MDQPENTPDKCCFCGDDINLQRFYAFGLKDSPATICGNCVDVFGVCSRFGKIFPLFFMDKIDFSPIKESLEHRLVGEGGSSKLKSIIVNLSMRFLLRACSRMSGLESKLVMSKDCMQEICPKTGIVLDPPRIAILSPDPETCLYLLELSCQELALFFDTAKEEELADGTAYTNMRDLKAGGNKPSGDEKWAENGIIACLGLVKPKAKCGVVFCLNSKTVLPRNVNIETCQVV